MSVQELSVWKEEEIESVNACPACEGTKRSLLHDNLIDNVFFCNAGKWSLHRCDNCESAYLSPRPTLQSIGKAYQSYYTHDAIESDNVPQGKLAELKLALKNGYLNSKYGYDLRPAQPLGRLVLQFLPKMRCKLDRLVRHLPLHKNAKHLLDVGCGNGAFVKEAKASGWNAEGMDPDPSAIASGHKAGIKVTLGALPILPFANDSFDAVTMSHSIEHVHDPITALKEAYRILKPNGVIWVSTPNLQSTGYKLFGKDWRGIETPRHLVLFNPDSLSASIKYTGFDKVEIMKPAFSAQWFFMTSFRISKGEDCNSNNSSPLPKNLKYRAIIADWLNYFFPHYGEEIIFRARKPF